MANCWSYPDGNIYIYNGYFAGIYCWRYEDIPNTVIFIYIILLYMGASGKVGFATNGHSSGK